MSSYYEMRGVGFKQVVRDIRAKKLLPIRLNESKGVVNNSRNQSITDGKNFVWLSPGTKTNSLGLKRWGFNDEQPFIEIIERVYKKKFLDEEELGFMHIG